MRKLSKLAALMAASKAVALTLLACTLVTFSACSDDNGPVELPYDGIKTDAAVPGNTQGMYVLNEGGFGKNNSTLDYLDFITGNYYPNIMASGFFNTNAKLGDTGNDIQLYNGKLWIVMNASNKVEVIDAKTGKIEKDIQVSNGRNLAYHNGYVYVSSYVSATFGGAAQKGAVCKIKESDYSIVGSVEVGYQPEQMAVVNNKIYVANSGGYNGSTPTGYDKTLSVIDIPNFTVTKTIDVQKINLNMLKADKNGNLWVTSRGDYASVAPCLIEVRNDAVVKVIDKPVAGIEISGDKLYYYSSPYGGKPSVGVIDVTTGNITNENLLANATAEQLPKAAYGIAINPTNNDIYLTDAKDYTSAGSIFVYNKEGKYKTTISNIGVSPAHICFVGK